MNEEVTEEKVEELRRRLGGAFTTDELVELYDAGTGWVSDLAVTAAPDAPFAWDVRIVGDYTALLPLARRIYGELGPEDRQRLLNFIGRLEMEDEDAPSPFEFMKGYEIEATAISVDAINLRHVLECLAGTCEPLPRLLELVRNEPPEAA